MITIDNFPQVLCTLGFEQKGENFSAYFPDSDCFLKVDFDKQQLLYPEDKGLIVNERQTCNFAANENFVVFECVHRLLKKGYKPKHIELEPKFPSGRGEIGGRADILIKDNNDVALLIIECKTAGREFNDAWKKTLLRPYQLFSYGHQKRSTQFLCLYASDIAAGTSVHYDSYIITVKDNEKLLEERKAEKLLTYNDANDSDDLFRAWRDTYLQDFSTKGIFEEDIQPYHIGKEKYALKDLTLVQQRDIQPKYNEFATILRQHNVAGRENAFDKLINLFLCKIVDEKQNPNNLKFYWKGIAYDTYFELIDRLQRLYKEGMQQFLKEDVTYVDNAQIDEVFSVFLGRPNAIQRKVKEYFRELKFFTNNDFAFIDVHNERLFYDNAVVLLKIVQMIQDIQLNGDQQNQFLGDLFEGFLDAGVKQSEGQFFTPMPITKFILMSLPLEEWIRDHENIPKAIDYACGAGHFLTELAAQIKPFVEQHKTADIKEYYRHLYGIEKEYRLSKVAKVSAFMYSQDEINIVYADALASQMLASRAQVQNGTFDLLVANPPFSVKGFLETLDETERGKYTLTQEISTDSLIKSNAIEAFFIERMKQLLAPGGIAGIIVPSSVLSNGGIYINTREILLRFFDIISIVELGSKTFGKTGTNTVVLFLRKKTDNPPPHEHYRNRVNDWFETVEYEGRDFADGKPPFQDEHLLRRYCTHIGIPFEEYSTLLHGAPSSELLQRELFQEYRTAFDVLAETKNLRKKRTFRESSPDKQQAELDKKFRDFLHSIEREKAYYFVMAHLNPQRVLIVKHPQSSKLEKQFLGYEWSGRKGDEGIKFLNTSSITNSVNALIEDENEDESEQEEETDVVETDAVDTDTVSDVVSIAPKSGLINAIQTPLFDPNNRTNPRKINTLIQANFMLSSGQESPAVPEELQPFVSYARLTDMLDFSRTEFTKGLSLSPKSSTAIETKWETVKLGTIVDNIGGLWTGKKTPFVKVNVIRNTNFSQNGSLDFVDVAQLDVEAQQYKNRKLLPNDIIIEKSGGSATQAVGRVVLFSLLEDEYSFSNFTARLRVQSSTIHSAYLHRYLHYFYEMGLTFHLQSGSSGLKNLDLDRYLEIKIPLPPLDIQQQIVNECAAIDTAVDQAQSGIQQAQAEIETMIAAESSKGYQEQKLSDITAINPSKTEIRDVDDNTLISFVEMASVSAQGFIAHKVDKPLKDLKKGSYTYFAEKDIIIAKITPCMENGKCAIAQGLTGGLAMGSSEFHVIRTKGEILNTYLFALLNRASVRKEAEKNMTGSSGHRRVPATFYASLRIPVPSLAAQKKFVAAIEKLETQIVAARKVVTEAAMRKQAVLKQYL
jgi:type I restriction enzyme M protein